MENIIIWQIVGFVVCFVLLFVFIAKYHAALEEETNLETEVAGLDEVTVSQAPVFKPRAALLQSAQAPAALEVADLKEQLKTLHYHLEELKASTQKHEADMAKQIARLEGRSGTFEQEVAKLQPTLLRVIEELEHLKGDEPAEEAKAANAGEDAEPVVAAATPDKEVSMPQSKSPVPELPEEELKF